jgi:hypothetical protein
MVRIKNQCYLGRFWNRVEHQQGSRLGFKWSCNWGAVLKWDGTQNQNELLKKQLVSVPFQVRGYNLVFFICFPFFFFMLSFSLLHTFALLVFFSTFVFLMLVVFKVVALVFF